MTYGDVLVKILSETTGKPESVFRAVHAKIPANRRGKLDQTCPDAQALLAELRQEKAGILNLLLAGRAGV